jgi:hypothetical protein
MPKENIIESLFKVGIGEYHFLHIIENKTVFGNLVYEKGRIYLRDNDLLSHLKPETLKPCWENGLIGMVCDSKTRDWESPTFYGLQNCELPEDLESTRHGFLIAAQNQYGEKLIDFSGSIYRGFDLMLQNNFLPVILLNKVKSKYSELGLAVTDLRTAPMPINLIQKINEMVRERIDQRLILTVEDSSLDSSDFEDIFRQYLNQNN